MFNPSREQSRFFFCESWRKHRERRILDGTEALAADSITRHPEFHALLENPDAALERDFSPDGEEVNPFLHLALHLTIAEQLSIDQPRGIKAAYIALCRTQDAHNAEHALMSCLVDTLWRAQRNNTPFDSEAYLDCMRGICIRPNEKRSRIP